MTDMMMKGSFEVPEFPLRPAGQPDPQMGNSCGPCDPLYERRPQAAEPWGYSTGLITFSLDASGNLVLGGGAELLRIFAEGTTDGASGGSQGYPGQLTVVQTDTYREGAIVKAGEKFVVTQIGVHLDKLCRVEFTGGTTTQVYEPWMEGYEDVIREVLRNNLSLSFVMGDDKCERLLGVPAFWREHSDSDFGVSSITPLRVPFRTGEKDAVDKIEMSVSTGYALRFANNAEWPTESVVSIPVRVVLYGYVETNGEVCETPRHRQGYEGKPPGYQQQPQPQYAQPPLAYARPVGAPDVQTVVAALSDPAMVPHIQRALATIVSPAYQQPPTQVPG